MAKGDLVEENGMRCAWKLESGPADNMFVAKNGWVGRQMQSPTAVQAEGNLDGSALREEVERFVLNSNTAIVREIVEEAVGSIYSGVEKAAKRYIG